MKTTFILALVAICGISTAYARPDRGGGADSNESATGIIVIDGLDQVDRSNRRPDMGELSAHRILIQLGDLVQGSSFTHEYNRVYHPTRESFNAKCREVLLEQACLQDESGILRIDVLNRFGSGAQDIPPSEMRYVRPSDLVSGEVE